MKNVCLAHNCIKCCLKIQMPLTDSDIRRISGLGFKNFFKVNKIGMRQLRNYKEKCTFHNGKICKKDRKPASVVNGFHLVSIDDNYTVDLYRSIWPIVNIFLFIDRQ